MKNYWLILLLTISTLSFSCAQKKADIKFDLTKYHNPTQLNDKRDSSIAFINFIHKKDYKSAEKIFPDMFQIDVTPRLRIETGKDSVLLDLDKYVNDYSNNTYDLLALTEYLRTRYNTKLELYDKMLRGSLRLDSTNVAALYLLTKVMFEHAAYKQDAAYLAIKMNEFEGQNTEIKQKFMEFTPIRKQIKQKLPSLYDFVRIDIRYPEKE